jgi:2-polyprenyl-6-methoxyphenol hydroxylase-like FAD-dependent oxidoreductase
MSDTMNTRCCIAGGGPAGMMLGYLLARAGVEVVVLEKHADFLRDFRGDTVHPSTLTVMDDLGLLQDFLKLPHQKVETLTADIFGEAITMADFSQLDTVCPYVVLMPQWDFLDFLAAQAKRLPTFKLLMNTRATAVIEHDDGRVGGVSAEGSSGALTIESDLVVAADGRSSTLRASAGLATEERGAPIDVLWFKVQRAPGDPSQTGGYVRSGAFLVTLNRDDYWQCAYVIPKGGLDAVKAAGIAAFRSRVASVAPFLAPALAALTDWERDIKLLTVQIDCMPHWFRDGLLCIGDAAHAMSPVGGIGINLAIQDAVATANLLAAPLRERRVTRHELAALQKRREWPTHVTQRVQMAVQNEILAPVLAGTTSGHVPLPLKLLQRVPMLRRIPARIVGIGVRPERVRTPAWSA